MFVLWHRFKKQELCRPQLEELILPLVTAMQEHLHDGCDASDRRVARFSRRLLKQSPGLWTFVSHDGVEPTNNAAERSLRRAVIWRRRSFGCHSAAGCRFVERLLTVVETLRIQQRDVVGYLTEAITAHRAKQPAPKLLPVG